MDTQLLQRTREILQNRIAFACQCPAAIFDTACAQLVLWLEQQPLLRPELEALDAAAAERGFAELMAAASGMNYSGEYPIATTSWNDQAALSLTALRRVSIREISEDNFKGVAYAVSGDRQVQLAPSVANLRSVVLANLAAFLDEALDGQFAVLALLKKYKQRSEWYRRARLRAIAGTRFEGQRAGEDSLMIDLYEYVHDQGVDFRIESWSASGRADLVSDVTEGTRLVLDGKYVKERHRRAATVKLIAQGLRQVGDYCRDHNEALGYLVTYLNQDVEIQFEGSVGTSPRISVGNVSVVCVFINIYEYANTASTRPRPTVVTISPAELVAVMQEISPGAEVPEDT